ncbi:2-succinyl-6-hydroxy-2,4-cyclohexadiene-1-carboxylate synthase [Bhargavaea cecembensis]|uniref:2-succinyl-6-hydroxy-2, 4-cyclohexadiene-1-carboxylate synthase n=1 Tax=Bhargavaea cecembensis TaxID=394098 RepID=UPI00084101C6|nr:2-succinyl-6-hydroxy-2,4-cyclohexadiene-1-carboxylate synthase [Bhargavaea cecembensis]
MEWLTASVRGLEVGYAEGGDPSGEPLVLLHGFTGSSAVWKRFEESFAAYRLIMPDLTGHGRTDSPDEPERFRMEEQVRDLDELLGRLGIGTFSLLGYSMGGRVAIGYAAEHPERVRRLILESTSPGLAAEQDRRNRRESDRKLAAFIRNEGIAAFTNHWESIPLFSSQKSMPEARRRSVREGRLRNRPEGLSGSLLGIGTGSQPSYWERLGELAMPVFLITGSLDRKYNEIAERMVRLLPDGRHVDIKDAGHAVHVENPERFATIVKEAMNNEGGRT